MKLMQISQQNKILLLSFLILIVSYFIFSSHPNEASPNKPERIYADTLIPKGMVLIPIDLANAEAVSGLMDQYGVVDLYTGSAAHVGSKKLASRVKILRAPLNPSQYAVLVPDALSASIMSHTGPYWAVVQNRNTEESQNSEKKAAVIKIEYHKAGG